MSIQINPTQSKNNEMYDEAIDEAKEAVECMEQASNFLWSCAGHLYGLDDGKRMAAALLMRVVQNTAECAKTMIEEMESEGEHDRQERY